MTSTAPCPAGASFPPPVGRYPAPGGETVGTATYDLTEGPVTRQLLIFAYPFVLSNLLQIVYNLVDLVVVGHFGGSVSQSAVSIGGDLSGVWQRRRLVFE